MQAIISTFLNPILPVFGLMLVGIVFARRGLFDTVAAQAINRFVFFVAVPALLFSLLSKADLGWMDWRVLALYFVAETILFSAGACLARLLFRRGWGESLLLGMASCFVNHVFFVLPIAQVIYGDPSVIPITAVIVVDTTVIFGGTIVGLEIASHRGQPLWRVAPFFLRNPVLISIFLGLFVNITGLPVHEGIRTFTGFAGAAAAPASLFALGIILAGRGWVPRFDHVALLVTGLKVLIHPLVAWLLYASVSGIEPLWRSSALLVAAGPCGSMPFVLALQYKVESQTIGRAIIYSTIASLFTLAVIA